MTWLMVNWRLALLMLIVAILAYMRIEVVWLRARLDKAKERSVAMQKELEEHDRLTKATTGSGMSDADRRKWLRDYAKRNRD